MAEQVSDKQSVVQRVEKSDKMKRFIDYLLNGRKWLSFLERSLALVVIAVLLLAIWVVIFAGPTSYFYSDVHEEFLVIPEDETHHGINTLNGIIYPLQDMVDNGIVMNFVGVRWWIDNRLNEEIGRIKISRILAEGLENNLARNRGTGVVNSDIANARVGLFNDYEKPILPSYTTMIIKSISLYRKFSDDMITDYDKPINQRKALFIPDAVNLSALIGKVKKEIQTTISVAASENIFLEDDEYYRIRGKLVSTRYFLQGVGRDFKEKLKDKEAYAETYQPLMELLDKTINRDVSIFITHYWKNDLASIRADTQLIANMMTELRSKLDDG